MKKLIILAALTISASFAQPFAYATVIHPQDLAEHFGLPYSPAASDYIQAFAVDYEPGESLVIQIDYQTSNVRHAHVETKTAGEYGSVLVWVMDVGPATTVTRIYVNNVLMWSAKQPKAIRQRN